MMTTELVDAQPSEIKFTFEVQKQSTCSIQLGNKSDQYVAFKVKTTSPKKYCVRPNAGIIKPNASCDFTVTMQAQKVAPADLQGKDKFLIQCTVVPFGISEKDITSNMFTKDCGKYIEEKKLRVLFTSSPPSPVFPVFLPANGELKQDPCYKTSVQNNRAVSGVENIPPSERVSEDVEGFESCKDTEESRTVVFVDKRKLEKSAVVLNLKNDFEELKLKLNAVDSKLKEADLSISLLTEENSMTAREKSVLQQELESFGKSGAGRFRRNEYHQLLQLMHFTSPPIEVPNYIPNNTSNTSMHPPANMTS